MDRVKEYIHRNSIERKEYRPLSSSPPSPPPSKEKARDWGNVLGKRHQSRQRAPDHHHHYLQCHQNINHKV